MPLDKPDKRLQELARKLLAGEISESEKEELDQWYDSFDDTYHEKISDETVAQLEARLQQAILARVHINKRSPAKRVTLWPRIAAVASIILCLGFAFYFYQRQRVYVVNPNLARQDIPPGRNRAILILANGKKVDLDVIKKGTIVHQNGLTITKTNNGQLVYAISATKDQSLQSKLSYNTIETPRGGRYEIKLPDGTMVWLNAASSLKYPIQFASNERRVELTGEAYFEVVHNKDIPFRVQSHGQMVEDVGTHFNISAYADDQITKTTLLEGAVKITAHDNTRILKPGQQAQASQSGIDLVEGLDLEEVVSWKNGDFKFNESLESIMTKIARWYDVEVVYQTRPDPDLTFSGKISRSRNISGILNMLSYNGDVHFRIEGRRVIVTK
jgi:transmembrane sensor